MADEKTTLEMIQGMVEGRAGVKPFTADEFNKADPGDANDLKRMFATIAAMAVDTAEELSETKRHDMWNAIKKIEATQGDEVLRARGLELIREPDYAGKASGAFLLDPDTGVNYLRSLAALQMPKVVKGTPGAGSVMDIEDICKSEMDTIKKAGIMDVPIGVWSGTHDNYKRKNSYNPHIMPITPREYYRMHGIDTRADETTTTLTFFVPVFYGSLIYTYAWEANPFRAGGATVLNVPYSTGKLPLLTGGYTAAYRAEAAAVSDSNLTDAQLSYTNLNYSVYTIVTKDLLASADIGVTMTQLIIQEMGKAMGTKEAAMGITGTGSSLWQGLDNIAAANIHAEPYTGSTLLDAFIKADGELGAGVKDSSWRSGAGWQIAGRGETVLKQIHYGSATNPVGYVFPPNQEVTNIVGKPVAYNENLYSGGKTTAYEYVRPLYYITQEPKMTTLVFDDSGRTNVSQNEVVFFLNMKTDGQLATRSLSKANQAAVKVTDIA